MKKNNDSQEKNALHEPDVQWRSEGHKMYSKIIQTSSWLRKISSDISNELNLTNEQGSILRALIDKKGVPVSTNELRYMMLTPMSDTPKIVDRLVKKGLVHKEQDKTDKRLVAVTITDEGEQITKKLASRSVEVWDNLEGFSAEDTMQLIALLDKLKASIKKITVHGNYTDYIG